jgi:hypothetical protein
MTLVLAGTQGAAAGFSGTGATVVVDATVVAAGAIRVIIFLNDLAAKLLDRAIFSVSAHEPVAPIVNFVGLRVGVNEHEPFFDHVFVPGEFVDTTDDNFFTWPAAKEETFHVTFVEGAAATEPPTATAAKTPARSINPADFRK